MRLTTSKNCKSGHLRPKLFEASRNVYQKMKFFGLTSLLNLLVAEDYSNYGSRLLPFLVWCTVFYTLLLSSCILKEKKKRFNLFNFFSSSGTRTPECFYCLLKFFVSKYSIFSSSCNIDSYRGESCRQGSELPLRAIDCKPKQNIAT